VSSALAPFIVGLVVQLTHTLAYTLLAVLLLIAAQIYFFGRVPRLRDSPTKSGTSYVQSLRDGATAFRGLLATNRLYLSFVLVSAATRFLMGGSYFLVIGLLFGVKLFAFKLGLLSALGAAGTAAGTFFAGWVKLRSGLQVYVLYTFAYLLDFFVALFPLYPIILALLTAAGVVYYVGAVHGSA
jgi:hypothetical protein